MVVPPKVHEAIGVLASSEATTTTTIRFGAAAPMAWLEYVATLVEADAPAGLAVRVMDTAID
jgi:hypothetical protein